MLYERQINISINPSQHTKKNGYVWATVNGALRSIPFIIDRPMLVKKGLNPFTYKRLVKQLNDMGINPDAIELHADNLKYIYDGSDYKTKTLGIPMSRSEIKENVGYSFAG